MLDQILDFLTFGQLFICLVLIVSLFMVLKFARLEPDFWENEKERQKLQLKPGSIKIFP